MAKRELDPESWRRVDELLARALELTGAEREALLAHECADDAGLRAEVESLLSGEARAAGFLDPESSPLAAPPASEEREDAWVGHRVGGFLLQKPLGSGGMGQVYEAWQESPGRHVAVKVMRRRLARPADVRRFEHEAAILGRLRHPCIAHLYDSGLVSDPLLGGESLPYIAMEIVPEARTLTEHARVAGLDLEERLRLFLEVCDGVHHAHQRGVLHRDLKPSNLIVDGEGRPRVIDFGIARSFDVGTGEETHTHTGLVMGTLQYMSPQQCGGAEDEVDVRSDVYSLGLVLYELVTGERPYDVSDTSVYEAMRVIREEAPRKPSRVEPACRGDLEVVILKALEKSPDDRYASVSELAEDVRRVLENEPIAARSPGFAHRLTLFARRNPLAATTSVAAILALVGGALAATVLAIREGRALRAAEQRERVASAVNDFLNHDLLGALDPTETADPDIRVRDALDRAALRVGERFADEPEVEAAISHSIGRAYASIGLQQEALPFVERAYALNVAQSGEGHGSSLSMGIDLAHCRVNLGDYDGAEELVREVLARLSEEDALIRAQALAVLANVQRERGDAEEALDTMRSSRELFVRARGEDDQDVLITDGNIAEVQTHLGRFEEAERLLDELHERSQRLLGEEHPRTVQVLSNQALARQNVGRHEEARELFEQALELSLRVQGPDHATTLTTRRNLGLVYLLLGRTRDAERETLLALEGLSARLGDDHLNTLSCSLVLGQLKLTVGATSEAEELLSDTLERSREALGRDHDVTQQAALHLSRCLVARDARTEAIRLLSDVLSEIRRREDPTETTLALLNYQGRLMLDEGRAAEAEPVLAEVSGSMRAMMGKHPGTAVALRNHGRSLAALERHDEAEAAWTEAHAMARELLGDQHGLTREVASMLADLYESTGRTEEATALRAGP